MEKGISTLSRLDDRQLGEVFQQRRHDPQFLDSLIRELNQRESDEAFDLQCEVVLARRAFARVAPSTEGEHRLRRSGPVRDWLRAFLAARNIVRPDGRELYRYRMADSEYDEAKRILRHLAREGRLAQPDDRAGALFVAYCGEWFRRESVSTFLRWNDPEPDLFPTFPDSAKRELTGRGLTYWQRKLRTSGSNREFLLTVALEGGFPVGILANGARGWLKEYLRSIMRRAIAYRVDTPDEILSIAEEERGRMRKSYQHDDFVALCSELVKSLLDLRQRAEAGGDRKIRNSAFLDIKDPGWRERLPIYVPAENEALVAELLTGLLDEKMTGLSTEGVEAKRYLVRLDGQWLPALQLLADGEIPPLKLPSLSANGRVRAIPTGELGNHLSGELALLEPPVGEQRRWRVRPFTRTAKLLKNFPFTSPVTATLTSPEGVPCSWTWPRGEPLRSDVLVFRDDEGSTPNEPLIRFLQSGSVSSPIKTLYVLFPDDWTVEPKSEDAIAAIESLPALGRKLACLTGAAFFRGGESDSVRFRVEPDTESREQELELSFVSSPGFDLADDRCELAVAPLNPLIRDRGKQRTPHVGELFSRRPEGKWAPLSGRMDGAGLIELSWRDPEAGIQLEKRLIALIPSGARVTGTMRDAQSGEIRLEALPDWTASVEHTSCMVEQTDACTLSFRFSGRPAYRLPIILRPPAGQPFEIIVPLVGRDAAIALADGSILGPGSMVSLGALRGASAISPRRTIVHLGAKGSKSIGLSAAVDGELPIGVLRSAIEETLATLPGQDDIVELDFIGDTHPPIRISRYRHEQLKLDAGILHWSEPPLATRVLPVARMILDPRHEHALEREAQGFWRIPESCKGLCLVYLRDGVDVVSRPVPVPLPGSPNAYSGGLASALSITDYEARHAAIRNALSRMGRERDEAGGFSWLLEATTNLNGLPASAFDALKLLPSCPEALTGLLLNARDAGERGIIWSLQNELPFLWLELPLSAWRVAFEADYTTFSAALETVFGAEKAAGEALARLAMLGDEMIALEPALRSIFSLLGISPAGAAATPSFNEMTNGYITSQFHRSNEGQNDLATRLASSGLKLPPEIIAKSHEAFAGLFAPVVLAASAQGRLSIESDLALLVRRTLREDPTYVSGAYAHLLKFYGHL
ncbi:STY4851/ECs_5259 family protein [Mesorhizobium loti]|uniref:STY4851/ECs_5259 family protein n=1 Tax=Rhizobium loti TaxID=381 RepID=UPI000408E51C|nr:STY4851/ECs_5259 family protein [Mesorhizobium loti]